MSDVHCCECCHVQGHAQVLVINLNAGSGCDLSGLSPVMILVGSDASGSISAVLLYTAGATGT